MDLNLVVQLLRDYENSRGRMTVLFISKTGVRYKSYKPEISNEVQQKINKLFVDHLVNDILSRNLEEVEFNPSGQLAGEYSVCNYDYVGNFEEVINLYNLENQEEMQVKDISFLIYRLRVNSEEEDVKYIYFFRRNTKFNNMRKGFWIRKITDMYTELTESDLIGIDGQIDCIAWENKIAFFAHITAERFFNLREKFAENAREVLDKISEGERIHNYEEFAEDCLNDARVTRRLTKIHSNPQILQLFHANFANAAEVVEAFDLNIVFNEDQSQIIYTEKEQLKDITLLIRDAYYRTVLANRQGIDDYN